MVGRMRNNDKYAQENTVGEGEADLIFQTAVNVQRGWVAYFLASFLGNNNDILYLQKYAYIPMDTKFCSELYATAAFAWHSSLKTVLCIHTTADHRNVK